MDFLHCNRCYKRNPPGGYLISSCFHILCSECTKEDRRKCSVCENDVKIVRLDGNIGAGIKMYFSDPIKTMAESLEKIQKKMDFQSVIRSHLMKHLMKQKEERAKLEGLMQKIGPEFKKQRKELEEAKSWIATAEQKVKQGEEENRRIRENYQELQRRFLQCHVSKAPPPPQAKPQFSFLMSAEDKELGNGPTPAESLNSTFNFNLNSLTSPAPSCESMGNQSWNRFFDNTEFLAPQQARPITDETLFAQMGSTGHMKSSSAEATAFSSTFNNMFTPSRRTEAENNKTSASLEHWRQNGDVSRRETSLPNTTTTALTPSSRRSVLSDRQQMREIRRCMGQPGFLAHRKSAGSRSSFLEPKVPRREHD